MQTGRPSKKIRPPFGARLHALREQAGLSQDQMARRLGISQRAYAYWERNPVALRPEQIAKLASLLNVNTDALILGTTPGKARGGPVGKARQIFEAVSRLPRSQQQHVLTVVEAFVKQQKVSA